MLSPLPQRMTVASPSCLEWEVTGGGCNYTAKCCLILLTDASTNILVHDNNKKTYQLKR